MSENEQKAGCVDGLRELIAFVNGKCSNEEAGRKCLGFIMLHGAELEAALSPARSGEAVAEIRGIDEYGPMIDWNTHWVELGVGAKLYAHPAPRNESSGVSPGGGEIARGLAGIAADLAAQQEPGIPIPNDAFVAMLDGPAPQDSVRVGDGRMEAARQWAQGLIKQLPGDHDGRNSWLLNYGEGEESDWLRTEHARYRKEWEDWRDGYPQPKRKPNPFATTPAPAAGADGEVAR